MHGHAQQVSGHRRYASQYRYRHGYFDGVEREFRGFGYVATLDTEVFGGESLFPDVPASEAALEAFQPPVRTRTWFHTGAYDERSRLEDEYSEAVVLTGISGSTFIINDPWPPGEVVKVSSTMFFRLLKQFSQADLMKAAKMKTFVAHFA